LAAELILIATSAEEEGDRIAMALAPLASYGFVHARNLDSAVQVATSLQPDLVIVTFDGMDGISLCQRLRQLPDTRNVRLQLIIDRDRLNDARNAGANSVMVQPASAMFVAIEAKRTLGRIERRTPWVPDRRTVFRGGRRLTDIGVG
jgi:PleD family two-component response regulator